MNDKKQENLAKDIHIENKNDDAVTGEINMENTDEIRDLSEFCLLWSTLRETLSNDNAPREQWPPEANKVFDWLMLLADRTCKLEPE